MNQETQKSDTASAISNMKFSTQNYAKYVKMEQQKKKGAKKHFKKLVDNIMDKKNWEQRWAKVKGFLGKGKNEKVQG